MAVNAEVLREPTLAKSENLTGADGSPSSRPTREGLPFGELQLAARGG